jgi:hypothetical protein
MRLQRAFFVLLVLALAGVGGSAAPGLFTSQAIAQTTPPPFSCFFAAFNQFNNLFNSGIQCGTPGPAGGGGTTLIQPSPPITVTQVTSSPLTYQIGLNIGNCLGVSGGGALQYTCPTGAPQATPSPQATATGCGTLAWSGSFPYLLTGNFSSCAANATPSPSATSTGCGTLAWSGSWPYLLTGNFSACGGASTGVNLYTPVPIPSVGAATPQPGYISVGGVFIGPQASPTTWPEAIIIPTVASACAAGGNQGHVSWGTDNTDPVIGVPNTLFGVLLRVGCYTTGSGGFSSLTLDGGGNLAISGSLYTGSVGANNPSIFVQSQTGINFPNSSTSDHGCNVIDAQAPYGIELVHATSGTCTFLLPDITATSVLCTDTTGNGHALIACPDTTGVHAYSVAVNTGGACTAFVSCGTVTFNWPVSYGTAPNCSGAAVQDATTAAQMWVTGISAISTTAVTWTFSPLATTGGAHALTLTFTCGNT